MSQRRLCRGHGRAIAIHSTSRGLANVVGGATAHRGELCPRALDAGLSLGYGFCTPALLHEVELRLLRLQRSLGQRHIIVAAASTHAGEPSVLLGQARLRSRHILALAPRAGLGELGLGSGQRRPSLHQLK